MGGGEPSLVNSADQFRQEWRILTECDVLALSQPLDLPDGTVIVVSYSDRMEVEHEPTAIRLPEQELIECLHRNSLTGGPLVIVHGLDAPV
jgi:hypothetical protein